MDKTRPPKWNVYRSIPEVSLWEAVALSLNIDPDKVKQRQGKPLSAKYGFDESEQFRERALVLERQEKSDNNDWGVKFTRRCPAHLASTIRLDEFAAWAQSQEWSMPLELMEIARAGQDRKVRESMKAVEHKKTQTAARWPWGDYETHLLQELAAAAEKFWVRFDPSDPSTATNNATVSAWLQQRGVSERTADVIATILRADGLRTGPR